MEGKPSRGRGGSWKRGDRGANSSDSFGGEDRGRGRGGPHRGRGRRDQQRGRGRGGSSNAAEFHPRDEDKEENLQEENDDGMVGAAFSRRKLESNWDRYEESERREPDDDVPTQRGVDYHVLLESAGDSFTQFRFSEEKDWNVDSFGISQMSALFVDLSALADCLQQVPLHQRLNLEAELVQDSTPLELPTMSLASKQEPPKIATFTPPSGALKDLTINHKVPAATKPASGSDSQVSSSTAEPLPAGDDDDEELDQLLTLQKPVSDASANQSVSVPDTESVVPEKACEDVKEKTEEAKGVTNHTSASARKEVTEEDLEDWLDSMIS